MVGSRCLSGIGVSPVLGEGTAGGVLALACCSGHLYNSMLRNAVSATSRGLERPLWSLAALSSSTKPLQGFVSAPVLLSHLRAGRGSTARNEHTQDPIHHSAPPCSGFPNLFLLTVGNSLTSNFCWVRFLGRLQIEPK